MNEDKWLIWSNEHRAWWRPESRGYTRHIEDAGIYSYDEAKKTCFPPLFRGFENDWPPPEIMIPLYSKELLGLMKEHFG